jgi:hypothetical protein
MSRLLQPFAGTASGLVLWFRIFLRLAVGPAVAQGCVFRSGFLEVLRQLTETYVRVLKKPVLRIRIHVFLGLQDPDPDPLVRGMDPDPALDPDPDPSIIMQK